jgi:glutamate-1-semialdehyde 2,1-aminomutase
MAAGAAATGELLTADVLDAVFERGESLRHRIDQVLAAGPLQLCVTGIGSLMTIHSVAGPVRSPSDLDGSDPVLRELLFHALVDRGIYLAPRGYIALSTAISDADCDRFVAALADAVESIAAGITAAG